MHTLPQEVFNEHILCHFDMRAFGQMSMTCHKYHYLCARLAPAAIWYDDSPSLWRLQGTDIAFDSGGKYVGGRKYTKLWFDGSYIKEVLETYSHNSFLSFMSMDEDYNENDDIIVINKYEAYGRIMMEMNRNRIVKVQKEGTRYVWRYSVEWNKKAIRFLNDTYDAFEDLCYV